MVHNATRRWDDKVAANQNIIVMVLPVCKNIELFKQHTPCQWADRILIPYFKIAFNNKLSTKSSTSQVNYLVLGNLKLPVLLLKVIFIHIWCFPSYGKIWEVGSVLDKKTKYQTLINDEGNN